MTRAAGNRLDGSTLWGLEEYARRRTEFRDQVIVHKKARRVLLGPHATLSFEDFLTMKYQVQEMLRIERIFEPNEIAQEVAAYEPLIPDGSNWKATFMIEYEDVAERRLALARLKNVEQRVWVEVEGHARVFAIANEDLPRSNDEKTAAVHFLRFELTPPMVAAAKEGAHLSMGIDHPRLECRVQVPEETRKSLVGDLS